MQTENLPSGSIAYLDGNFAEHRNTIKSKLKTLGVQVKTAFDASITHLVIGKNLELAAKLLSRPFSVRGEIVKGDQRGRTLGFELGKLQQPLHQRLQTFALFQHLARKAFAVGGR